MNESPQPAPKPRLRWYQYSLASLFVHAAILRPIGSAAGDGSNSLTSVGNIEYRVMNVEYRSLPIRPSKFTIRYSLFKAGIRPGRRFAVSPLETPALVAASAAPGAFQTV